MILHSVLRAEFRCAESPPSLSGLSIRRTGALELGSNPLGDESLQKIFKNRISRTLSVSHADGRTSANILLHLNSSSAQNLVKSTSNAPRSSDPGNRLGNTYAISPHCLIPPFSVSFTWSRESSICRSWIVYFYTAGRVCLSVKDRLLLLRPGESLNLSALDRFLLRG